MGLILSGQNANVRQWKSFDRSDFENVVNVHLGSNCYHAIENSNLSEPEKKKLKDSADKLMAFCEAQNADVIDEDIKARFALVIEPNKTPFFIELPRFGSIYYDNSKQVAETIDTPASKLETVAKTNLIQCPDCGSQNLKFNGRGRKDPNKKYYKCKGCNGTFNVCL